MSSRLLGTDEATTAADGGYGRSLLAYWENGWAKADLPERGILVLGRSKECDVVVDHGSISRRHVALHVDPHSVRVEDLGSSNGTRVGKRTLRKGESMELPSGATIDLGGVVIVVRQMDDAVPSRPFREAPWRELLDKVAASTIPVLLLGETGVGKEVAAARVHQGSPRASKSMVTLNCAALPEALLESELFGHEAGAFTGAVRPKAGLLEDADGGTVFLDELAEMPLATQAKLLRVLESGEIRRVGSLRSKRVDVRLVAATNRDLDAHVKSGSFREDLYFRLNGVVIAIPPLRDRKNEIGPLAAEFVAKACARASRPTIHISRSVLNTLEHYPWPGNIRELRTTMERAVVMCNESEIMSEHLLLKNVEAPTASMPPPAAAPSAAPGGGGAGGADALRSEVAAFEKERIVAALDRNNGNQTQAAKELGISRRTLVNRLDEYDIPRPRKRDE